MKDVLRGNFETPVTFEIVWKTIWAWITRKNLVHKDVLIVPKEVK